eukprot:TRINITY_DN6826_c0_g1_i1.p1 TRINITY_DN6826_c0_g1~~TRINITY_DN6826_c0_g1_i1.p1  ORF type:complete len:51 (-),score=16.14 TRINITY_DN6826_c0_g1_i1:126-278(-)
MLEDLKRLKNANESSSDEYRSKWDDATNKYESLKRKHGFLTQTHTELNEE